MAQIIYQPSLSEHGEGLPDQDFTQRLYWRKGGLFLPSYLKENPVINHFLLDAIQIARESDRWENLIGGRALLDFRNQHKSGLAEVDSFHYDDDRAVGRIRGGIDGGDNLVVAATAASIDIAAGTVLGTTGGNWGRVITKHNTMQLPGVVQVPNNVYATFTFADCHGAPDLHNVTPLTTTAFLLH